MAGSSLRYKVHLPYMSSELAFAVDALSPISSSKDFIITLDGVWTAAGEIDPLESDWNYSQLTGSVFQYLPSCESAGEVLLGKKLRFDKGIIAVDIQIRAWNNAHQETDLARQFGALRCVASAKVLHGGAGSSSYFDIQEFLVGSTTE